MAIIDLFLNLKSLPVSLFHLADLRIGEFIKFFASPLGEGAFVLMQEKDHMVDVLVGHVYYRLNSTF